MQWEFTPEDVVKGVVGYDLDAFRHDLRQEVANNLSGDDDAFIQQGFDLIYDLCYWMSTGREFNDFAATLTDESPLDADALREIGEYMQDNVSMLGAILQRMIMDSVAQGLPVEQAVEVAAKRHHAVVTGT